MSNLSAKNGKVVLNLEHDSQIANRWFIDNGIEHPEKFQFMVQ